MHGWDREVEKEDGWMDGHGSLVVVGVYGVSATYAPSGCDASKTETRTRIGHVICCLKGPCQHGLTCGGDCPDMWRISHVNHGFT